MWLKSFLLNLPYTISWNFQGWTFVGISKNRQRVFLSYLQFPCLEFFWNSPISSFCLKFPRVKMTNLKILQIFFKKGCSWPPFLTLFGFLLEWAISEKKNRGFGGYAVWGSFRSKEIASGTSRGSIKTMWNFSGVIKKKSYGIFRGLGFRHHYLKCIRGVKHNFVEFRGEHNSEALFCLEEFPRVKKRTQKFQGVSKKYFFLKHIKIMKSLAS